MPRNVLPQVDLQTFLQRVAAAVHQQRQAEAAIAAQQQVAEPYARQGGVLKVF